MITMTRAADLPKEWDSLAQDNYALQRTFLSLLETSNPCQQQYHLFHAPDGRLDSIVMSIRVRMNLTQYSPINWHVQATMIHVPLSVTRPAHALGNQTRPEVERFIRSIPGYTILLNWRHPTTLADLISGTMSPQVTLPIRWDSFNAYLADMRSNYRHRYHKALKKGAQLHFRILDDNAEFSDTLYQHYLFVNAKSRIRIETLSIEYFRQPTGKILLCESQGIPVGFMQIIENGHELIWAFVGYDHSRNHELDIYINMLLALVRYAIEHGFKILEMGQTAEEAKLKLGGQYTPLSVLVRHSNPLLHRGMKLSMPFLSYRPVKDQFRVFHGEST